MGTLGRVIAPERRTRGDLIAAAAVVIVVIVAAAAVWWTSSARRSTLTPAAGPIPPAAAPSGPPAELRARWSEPSPATSRPVFLSGVAVTAGDGDVVGRDPATGGQLWRYHRDAQLCDVTGLQDLAVAAYRQDEGCGDVTAIRGASGLRGPTRRSDADRSVTLTATSTAVLSAGESRIEAWGPQLFREIEYGRTDNPVKPGVQPRSGCTLRSAVPGVARIAIVEDCPGDVGHRLTVIESHLDKDDKVVQNGSSVITGDGHGTPPPLVLGAGPSGAVVFYPAGSAAACPGPAVAVLPQTSSTPRCVPVPAGPAGSLPAEVADVVTWWTGTATVVVQPAGGRVAIIPSTLGPATIWGGRLVVATAEGIGVLSTGLDGRIERTIPVTRDAAPAGPVYLEAAGPGLVELAGGRLTGLLPPG